MAQNRYYASVNFGMEALVEEILRSMGAEDVERLPSAVLYTAPEELVPPCVNNRYRLLERFSAPDAGQALRHVAHHTYSYGRLAGKTFRVVVMERGKLVAVDRGLMDRLERNITAATGLKSMRAKPDVEIWLNVHNTGKAYYMVRLEKHASFDKALHKGELRGDIAQAMVHCAGLPRGAAVLDPMAGWGAIPQACTAQGVRTIIAGDRDAACIDYMKTRFAGNKHVRVYPWDARRLPWQEDHFDAVITDPPWGEYTDLPEGFYEALVPELFRVLRPGRRLVLLSAWEGVEALLHPHGALERVYPLVVNGRESRLYVAVKHAQESAEIH